MGLDHAKAKRRDAQRQAEADARAISDARRRALGVVASKQKPKKGVRVGRHYLPPSNPGLELRLDQALKRREREVLNER